MHAPVWHGTPKEAQELSDALAHNCACAEGPQCGAHRLAGDQKTIDHLLFMRRLAPRLRAGEFRGIHSTEEA